jgi:hypothetical protein
MKSFAVTMHIVLTEMLDDVRKGVWSELSTSSAIDIYRRNLQRSYLNHVASLMESNSSSVHGSDIKALLQGRASHTENGSGSCCKQNGRPKNGTSPAGCAKPNRGHSGCLIRVGNHF